MESAIAEGGASRFSASSGGGGSRGAPQHYPKTAGNSEFLGKPQGKTLRNGFLHEALDEMTTPQQTTPQMKKNDMMQSSGK